MKCGKGKGEGRCGIGLEIVGKQRIMHSSNNTQQQKVEKFREREKKEKRGIAILNILKIRLHDILSVSLIRLN